jgi:hypothetical protein
MNTGDGSRGRPNSGAVEGRPMPSDVLSCPYCNSPTAVPAGAHLGQRIPCPRCGESFPYRAPADEAAVTAAPPQPAPPTAPLPKPEIPQVRRFSNKAVALTVLAVMGGMALLGLTYALSTEALRRSYDAQLPKTRALDLPWPYILPPAIYVLGLLALWFWGWNRRDSNDRTPEPPWRRVLVLFALSVLVLFVIELAVVMKRARTPRPAEPEAAPPVRAVPPADLAALGYLPDDTDLIMAVHVAELLEDPVGRKLADHLGSDAINATSIESWSGLKLAEMDHAVLGFTLDNNLLTHFVIVVRTRRPLDQEKVRETLKVHDARPLHGRTVYPFVMKTTLPFISHVDVNAWFADDHTLVVAKTFDDGKGHQVPTTARTGSDHLRPALRQLLRERVGASAQVWLAGHPPPWNKMSPLLQGVLERKENEAVAKVRTFGLWLTADAGGATLRGAFDCDDEDAARALEGYLGPGQRKGIKEWLVGPDAGPMEREFRDSLKTARDGTWVDLQARASARALGK